MKITDITWETDGLDVDLPTELDIPIDVADDDKISDYLSDEYGYLVVGYCIETIH